MTVASVFKSIPEQPFPVAVGGFSAVLFSEHPIKPNYVKISAHINPGESWVVDCQGKDVETGALSWGAMPNSRMEGLEVWGYLANDPKKTMTDTFFRARRKA
jgi:hypothetical protein